MRHQVRLKKSPNSTGLVFVLSFASCSLTDARPPRAFVEHLQYRCFLPITAHHQSRRILYDSQPRSTHTQMGSDLIKRQCK